MCRKKIIKKENLLDPLGVPKINVHFETKVDSPLFASFDAMISEREQEITKENQHDLCKCLQSVQ